MIRWLSSSRRSYWLSRKHDCLWEYGIRFDPDWDRWFLKEGKSGNETSSGLSVGWKCTLPYHYFKNQSQFVHLCEPILVTGSAYLGNFLSIFQPQNYLLTSGGGTCSPPLRILLSTRFLTWKAPRPTTWRQRLMHHVGSLLGFSIALWKQFMSINIEPTFWTEN